MDEPIPSGVGLCATCRHVRVITSGRGSRFLLCGRSRDDERYPRYPSLPVRACPGYESIGSDGPSDPAGTAPDPPSA